MATYKSGQWWVDDGQRALANISAAYTEKPDIGIFMKEWQALYESKSGERGIFNRVAARKASEATGRRDSNYDFGTNPCGEIILRPWEFCNLSETVVRSTDTIEDLQRKVRLAAILGTFQSSLTDFKYIRKAWAANCREERLLGVSLTGIMDHSGLAGTASFKHRGDKDWTLQAILDKLKDVAIDTNKEWAEKLGIEQSVAITTIKPSGTVSQLVDSASGIHPRYSKYYTRTVRADVKDPLATFLKEEGVPCEPDVTNGSNLVFSFPVRSPDGAVLRNDISALQQLEHYLVYKRYWCEHNPSITVYVREDEWLDVGAWVYKNLDDCGGISFLPHSDHVYQQAPYQELDAATFYRNEQAFPTIDWGKFNAFEGDDSTLSMHELACVGGVCEII
jgi:ribonucleoside-diphosphate reductase alpha chain